MITVDPVALARRQLALDRAKTSRFPSVTGLFERKLARMSASPLAFLRGAAPLFYELLAAHPTLAEGPRGKGWLAGDLHLENFGAYRPLPIGMAHAKKKRENREDTGAAEFNLNDFDDAFIGPWRLDVLRLTTSLILGGRELGAGGPRVLDLADKLLAAYVAAAFEGAELPRQPDVVARLVHQAGTRTRKELLDARTVIVKGARRFVRGPRYAELPPAIARGVPKAFARYARALPDDVRPEASALEVIDAAWRIAGTGSLGGVRIAVLARGKGGPDGAWIFDMKEQGGVSACALVGRPTKEWRLDPAARVLTAFRACVERPPRLLGTSALGGTSLFVRKLAPQEDKLDLAGLADADLDPLAGYLGALIGRAHARGATKRPSHGWTSGDRATLLDRAIAVAGIHEAVYLAICKLTRDRPREDARLAKSRRG